MNLEKKIARRLLFNYLLWLSKTRVLGGATEKILCLLVCVFDKHFRLFNLKGFNLTFKTRVLIFKKTLSVTPPWLFPLCHFFVVWVCVSQREACCALSSSEMFSL